MSVDQLKSTGVLETLPCGRPPASSGYKREIRKRCHKDCTDGTTKLYKNRVMCSISKPLNAANLCDGKMLLYPQTPKSISQPKRAGK
jgi:hypothetical protein